MKENVVKLIDILSYDKVLFLEMVKKCNETYRSGHDLSSYLQIIGAHRRTRNIIQLIEDPDFVKTIYPLFRKVFYENPIFKGFEHGCVTV